MFKLKPLPTLTGIVAGAILITNLVHSEPTQQGGPVDTIKAIVHDAKAEGGMIVECRGAKHLCRDLATDELVGPMGQITRQRFASIKRESVPG
jgi:hypothetical protein